MEFEAKLRSRLFFIVLFLVLFQIVSAIAIADSKLDDTDKELLIDEKDPSTRDSEHNSSSDELLPSPTKESDTSVTALSPSRSPSLTNIEDIIPTKPYTSYQSAVNAEKYAPSLSAATQIRVAASPEIEIIQEQSEDTLRVNVQSNTNDLPQVSVLGQICTGDGDVEIRLPPLAHSLTHVLVIIEYEQDRIYARYMPLE